MTVAELIAELSKHDPWAVVITRYDSIVEKYVVNAVERSSGASAISI